MGSAIGAASRSCFGGLTALIPPNCYARDASPLRTSALRDLSRADSKLPSQIIAFFVSRFRLAYRLASVASRNVSVLTPFPSNASDETRSGRQGLTLFRNWSPLPPY